MFCSNGQAEMGSEAIFRTFWYYIYEIDHYPFNTKGRETEKKKKEKRKMQLPQRKFSWVNTMVD